MNIFGTSFNYEGRLDKIRKLMDEKNMDCLLVHQWVNQYYVSGFYQHLPWYPDCHSNATEAPLVVFRDKGQDPVFISASGIYRAVMEGTWIKDVRTYDRGSTLNVYEYTAKVLQEKGLEAANVGIEEDCCTVSTFRNLQQVLPRAQFKYASEIFHFARVVKEPEEIAHIKESVLIAEAGMKVAMEVAKPGVTEMEVQRAAELEMRRRGGIREVETMCQSGKRTANFRAFAAAWKKIEKNDLVMVDLGCVYNGYGSDITRTWIVGKPTDEQKKMAKDLYRVQEKLLKFIKPGLKYNEVTGFVRDELKGAGYQTNKDHYPYQKFSFHGVGLGPFHDIPSERYHDMVLEPGMVISAQPSICHEDFTIRFEDDAVLTADGIEMMSTLPRELI